MMDRWLCGWRVRSELPLPELFPWTGDDRAPDLTITLGAIPELSGGLAFSSASLRVATDGRCRFAVQDVASYLIDSTGRAVTVAPLLAPDAPVVRVFLLGTVFGILCHKRNLLPLHASCVRIGGDAVAFAGNSGVGKSTLAAAFLKRGHAVLADDVTVVDMEASGGPIVWPALPRLRLWHDAVTHFGLPLEGLEQDRSEPSRYNVRIDDGFTLEPRRLAAIYCLKRTPDSQHEAVSALRGLRAVRSISSVIYRRHSGRMVGGDTRLMLAVKRLCATVPTHLLTHRPTLTALDGLAEMLSVRHEMSAAACSA